MCTVIQIPIYLQDTLPFPDRPSPDRLKSCRTVPKMVYNSLKQAPSDIKSAFFLPDASSRTPDEQPASDRSLMFTMIHNSNSL